MNTQEMIRLTKELADDPRIDDHVESVYLPMAKAAVVSRLFPFDEEAEWDDVPDKYHLRTCEIAVYLYNRKGSEGEVRHVENGTTHEWESAGIPKSLLADLTPHAGVI